ncbi:glycosyltransferase [Litchfieldella rifensis]|uniref:Glycosyltransferase n=1 Tax=Litchfieldella rifensis TaxID=762643 RepID=A0ABV7LUU7_9GAMM
MKYLHIIEATATGTLSMASLLANAQQLQGNDVKVVYSLRPETPEDIEEFFVSDIKKIMIDMSSPKGKLLSIFSIKKVLDSYCPDVIVMHSSFAGFIGRLAVFLSRKKSNCYYIPHCISFMRKDIGNLKKGIFVALERIASIKKCTYIACSNSELEEIKSKIPNCECLVVENAVSDSFSDIKNSTKKVPEKKSIVSIGQIRTQKNPKLFAEICKNLKGRNIEFIWVGDGDEDLKSHLIGNGVVVTGWVSPEEVKKHLANAKIYLSTSSWEGLPVSLIEASYADVVIVATNCPGNTDIVTDGHTGYLYKDAGEAAKRILALLASDETMEKIAKQARECALSRFSYEGYVRKMTEIMESN